MYEKARVAKHALNMEYCVPFDILPKFGQIVLITKELFEVGRMGVIVKFQLQHTMHPCKCGIPTQPSLLQKTVILGSVQYNYEIL